MLLRFLDFTLDPAARSLVRGHQPQAVTRRELDCLVHLVKHRGRAVPRDELISVLWQRNDVSYNQLAQLVTAVRHLLGDDGHAQRVIRTVPGYGYHWVLPVQETEHSAVDLWSGGEAGAELAHVEEIGLKNPPEPADQRVSANPAAATTLAGDAGQARPAAASRYLLLASMLLVLLLGALAAGLGWKREAVVAQPSARAVGLLESLQRQLRLGDFDTLARRLSELPPALASTETARLLATDLDLRRGRWPAAGARIARDLGEARAAGNLGWEATLWVRKTELLMYSDAAPAAALAASASALELIESVPAAQLADSLKAEVRRAHGRALLAVGELDPALRELAHARDLFLQGGDRIGAADTSGSMARAWLRHGRLSEALGQLLENAELYAAEDDPFAENLARNTALRLQVELLRWDEALANSERAMALLKRLPGSERRYRTRQLRVWPLLGTGRLREAAALLEELGYEPGGRDLLLLAQFEIASGRPEAALAAAAAAFADGAAIGSDPGDVLYETREGGLLLWLRAATALSDAGASVPVLPAGARAELEAPGSSMGRIARGQWLLLRGDVAAAIAPLRQALAESRALNQSLRMRLAAEPLVAALLRSGDIEGAARVLAELRAHDPLRFDGDFRTAELRVRVRAAQGHTDSLKPACQRASTLAGERPLSADIRVLCGPEEG